jgi:hypothetical protein
MQQKAQDIPESPLSPRNVEDTQVTPTKKQGKLPKMRGKMKEKQHSPEIFKHNLSLWKPYSRNPLRLRKERKGKGIKALECPVIPTGKPELQIN